MSDSTSVDKRVISQQLANAHQTLEILKSQLRSGAVERDYWTARLNDLSNVLEAVSEHQVSVDQQQRLAALYEVSHVIGSSLDLNEVLNQVMDAIIQLTDAERGFLAARPYSPTFVSALRILSQKGTKWSIAIAVAAPPQASG